MKNFPIHHSTRWVKTRKKTNRTATNQKEKRDTIKEDETSPNKQTNKQTLDNAAGVVKPKCLQPKTKGLPLFIYFYLFVFLESLMNRTMLISSKADWVHYLISPSFEFDI